MSGDGVPNRNFDKEMRRYNLGRTQGTAEYAHRLDYPGDMARAHVCVDRECVNFRETTPLETYWICEACSKAAPDSVKALTHCPYKVRCSEPRFFQRQSADTGPPGAAPQEEAADCLGSGLFGVVPETAPNPTRRPLLK